MGIWTGDDKGAGYWELGDVCVKEVRYCQCIRTSVGELGGGSQLAFISWRSDSERGVWATGSRGRRFLIFDKQGCHLRWGVGVGALIVALFVVFEPVRRKT